jgi:pimeloyl-ACP methyl ester carboxylesterase
VIGGHSMGGAMAICVAAARPELVARLVLVSPAGLPLTKPISRSLADFTLQLAGGRYPIGHALDGIRDTLSAPRAAFSVARSVHDLDLSSEMRAVRDQGVPSAVIGCSSDSLVTVAHCRRAALLLGATYRELALAGGHMWMLRNWSLFRDELAAG